MSFFTVEKIQKQLIEIRQAIYREVHPIIQFKFYEGDCPGAEYPAFDDQSWRDFRVGETWGGYDKLAWFRTRVPIPAGWHNRRVYLRFLVGPRDGGGSTAEAMLYVNGTPLQAIDIWHEEAWLPPEQLQGDEIVVALKAWSGTLEVPDVRRFKLAQLIWIDEAAECFYHLSHTLLQAIKEIPENDLRRIQLVQALDDAYRRLDWTRPGSADFYHSVQDACEQLGQQVATWQAVAEIKPKVVGIGHAHIDMAWLWRLSHTREKAARTFATALHLMRQYPDYRFMHSSPQLYRFLQEDYPEIFAQVKAKIAAGQWEITGGMWVEADVNLPGGESLIRQFLLGRQYIRQEFGVETTILWLPDVFGYPWTLPQIVRQSGMKYFLTSKISWSQFNRFPNDTFRWRGLDGTELLTHFITAPETGSRSYTYNGMLSPPDVKGIWDNYRQKEINDELLLLFGWGDGGGGPTKEMLESARVLRNLPGLPAVSQERAESYFARLGERLADKQLPVWDGELYLEYHRGTYTSQAYNKWANRRAEELYHNAEWLSAIADLLVGQPAYPAAELRRGWELILLNQFHDILPGSSIRQVYEDSREDYRHIFQIGETAVTQARDRLLAQISARKPGIVVFNPLSWPRDDMVVLPAEAVPTGQTILDADGRPALSQRVTEGGESKLLLQVSAVPALGYRLYPFVNETPLPAESATDLTITPTHLENQFYRLELNECGQIISLSDKRQQREVIAPGGRGNIFQTFVDKPMAFDAWDIDLYYQEKMQEVNDLIACEVEETGPLRGVLRLQWRFYDSLITQRLTLYRHSPRLDFRTEVEWQERQILLKVAFPVAVRSTRATYDIQFGHIERPTHWNTSWDYARFEVVGHKWADLSEGNYGVALLNDCKYGYDVKDNVLRLTLIKSAIRPDATADKGHHHFTYSLLPHAGDWRSSDVVTEGYNLNNNLLVAPIATQPDGRLPDCYQLAAVDVDHVMIETVKQAEVDNAWIIRLYEYKQQRNTAVTLTLAHPIRRAVECNLVEEAEEPIACNGHHLTFAVRPYEIKSFKVWLAE